MRKKEEATNNIIFNDNDLNYLVREIAKKACEKGIPITHLIKAIHATWKEEISHKICTLPELPPDVTAFSERAKKFLHYYENALIDYHDQYLSVLKISDIPSQKDLFLNSLFRTIIIIYMIFNKKTSVTKNEAFEISKTYFGTTSYTLNSIEILHNFLYNHLSFESDLPTYSAAPVSKGLFFQNDFRTFLNQYRFRATRTNNCAFAIIWFISKYF